MKNFPGKGGLSIQKNEIFRLSAEKLGAEMEGICRLDGMPVFVPGLLPGEETDIRIVKAEKRYACRSLPGPPGSRLPRISPLRRVLLPPYEL